VNPRLRARVVLWASLALIGSGCLLGRRSRLLESVELKTYDWRSRAFSDSWSRDPRIVLLLLDQQSLDHFERDDVYWPWPRSIYGAVLEFAKAGGARAVVFDTLFTSPSPYGPSEDLALAKALKAAAPMSVTLAMETSQAPPRKDAAIPARLSVPGAAASAVEKRSARLPVAPLLAAASAVGDTAAAPDADGVFRRVPLYTKIAGAYYPTLASAAALAMGRAPAQLDVPLSGGRMLVRFHGARPYPEYSVGRAIQAWQNVQEKQPTDFPPEVLMD
jgi:adenylate cyclase